MKRLAVLLVVALVAAACSGVSQEEHDTALAEVDDLKGENASLVQDLSRAESDLEGMLEDASSLEDELARTEEALAEAQATIDQLGGIPEAPNVPGAVFLTVLGRGHLRCGVTATDFAGFAEPSGNSLSGFDVDFCRAVAAAVLGDADAVEYVRLTAAERWSAVRLGQVDVLFRISTYTTSRDAALGEQVDFGPVTFYDGLKFMGPSTDWSTASSGTDMGGARVCVDNDAVGEFAARYAGESGAAVEIVAVPTLDDAIGNPACDLVAADGILLAHVREFVVSEGRASRDDLTIFPPMPISREPLAPAYVQGDTIWADIVDWVVYSTIIADAKGITSSNIDTVAWDAEAARLFGAEGEIAALLGLTPDAFYRVIQQVGNYGEIYDRHLTSIGYLADDGPNRPFSEGGLLYAPPAR